MQSYQHISIQRPTPAIGAEVDGVKLASLDEESAEEINRALAEFKVLFFRDQSLDLDGLCRFSRHFGELMKLPYIKPVDSHPSVIAVLKEADEINMGVFGGDWHSDFSFLEEPPAASILYADDIPVLGGDTLWINMVAAYHALPRSLKKQVDGREVVHTGAPYGQANAPNESDQFKGSIEIQRNNPEADAETLHPAVCRHPQTGEKMLFVNPTYTTRFADLSKSESEPVLKEIYAHCTRPEFSCRFRWSTHAVAMWDNRSTMHYAVNDYDGYRRLMYRTTIAGHAPHAAVP